MVPSPSPSRRVAAHLALRAALAAPLLALSAGCGDPGDLEQTAGGEPAAVTLTVPTELGDGWELPETGVDVAVLGERSVLLFERGDEPCAVTFPAPGGAAGAGRVVLRVLSDGPFEMQVALGDRRTSVARSAATLRRWKEMAFALPGPLTAGDLAGPLQVVRVTSELPVAVEAIRFVR